MSDALKSLTFLRFFAAFWVVLFHLKNRIEYDSNSWFWSFVDNGARGVDFFFMLSGFVIFHVYERQIADGKFSFWRFCVKRFARIYPLHLVMLLGYVAFAQLGNNSTEGWIPSLLLVHAWSTTDGLVLNGPSWTLSAEAFAYILFALVVVRPPKTWMLGLAFVASFAAVHALAINMEKAAFLHLTWDFGVLRILPLFILGMLLKRISGRVTVLSAAIMGVCGLVTLAIYGSAQTLGYEIIIPFALLIVSAARLSHLKSLPTNGVLPVYLGEISYSIYMIHLFVIAVFFDYLPKLGVGEQQWLIVCAAIIFGSAISYHMVERPARSWINKRVEAILVKKAPALP